MSEQTCACSNCGCVVNEQSIQKDGQRFCCEACATGHADGSKDCGHNCQCG